VSQGGGGAKQTPKNKIIGILFPKIVGTIKKIEVYRDQKAGK